MSSFTSTRRGNPCEVCGNESGKCRQHVDGEITLCRTFADAKFAEIENGFKCIKPDSAGKGWATFKLDNSIEWSQEQRLEWQSRLEAKRRLRDIEDAQRSAEALSLQERDRQYRALLAELTLHPEDRADLIRRGFTNQQINLCEIKSVEQWQKLQSEFSHLLPGVNIDGRSLLTQTGYLCPIRNVDGLIVGCQVRLRALGDSGRYRWLTSRTQKRPHGQSPHLYPDGHPELPLAVFRPVGEAKGLALVEGTGAKPFLVSQRLALLTLGAAGGQWLASQAIFKDHIDRLSAELAETRKVILFPDGGDVLNRAVVNRWLQVISLLVEWGYSVTVGWWGQVAKQDPDIDELTDLSQVQQISVDDFKAICLEHGALKPEQKLERDPIQQPAKGFKQLEAKDQVPQSKPSGEGWDNWRKSKLFSADHTINQKHFTSELPRIKTLLAVRSGLGTGKTRWVVGDLLKAFFDEGILAVGYRNSNLIQFCDDAKNFADVNFYHLQRDLKGKEDALLIADRASRIACCVDSLIHFQPSDFDGKIVILDEIESIVSHLLRSNTAVGFFRERIKELFVEMLNRASRIICLDGHLTDSTLNYLQSLQSDPKELIKIQNLYQGNRGRVEFYEGAESGSELKVNDYSPVFEAIKNNQNCFAIGSDSQTKIESLDMILREQGKKTLRLDSTTSTQKWVEVFLKNPARYLQEHRIEVFLYSPSAEAGLNIDIQGYFSDIYFLFFGVITTSAQMQMMGRIRDPESLLHVYCKQQGLPSESVSKSSIPEQLQKEIKTYVQDCAMASLKGVDKQDLILDFALKLIEFSSDRHFEHETRLVALENHERAHLRDCLRESLIHSGYQLTSARGQKSDTRQLTEQDKEVRAAKATSIFEARDITTEQTNELASNFQATAEDKAAIARRRLLDRLPGIESATYSAPVPVELVQAEPTAAKAPLPEYQQVEKPVFSPELIERVKFGDRGLISKVELRWLVLHPEEAQKLQQVRWYKKLNLFTDPDEPDCSKKMNLSTYNSRWLKVTRLLEMGLDYFLQPGATWSDDSPEVLRFYNMGKDPKFFRAVRTKVGDSTPCEYVGRVLKSLELKTKSTFHQKKRVYQVDPDCLADPILNAIFEAVGRRFEDYLFSDKAVVSWQSIGQSEGTQTQSQQGLEGDTPSANFVRENQPGVSGDEWLDLTNLESMARDLEAATGDPDEGPGLIALMRQCWPVRALTAASRLLQPEIRQKLKRLIVGQNQQGWSAA